MDSTSNKKREYQKLQIKIVAFSLSAIVLGVLSCFFIKNILILTLIVFFLGIAFLIVYKTKMKLESLEERYDVEKTFFEREYYNLLSLIQGKEELENLEKRKYIAFREYYTLLSLILYNFYDNPKIETICCIYLNAGVNPRKKLADIPISKEQETNLKKVFGDNYNKIMEMPLGASLLFLIKTEMDIKQRNNPKSKKDQEGLEDKIKILW